MFGVNVVVVLDGLYVVMWVLVGGCFLRGGCF